MDASNIKTPRWASSFWQRFWGGASWRSGGPFPPSRWHPSWRAGALTPGYCWIVPMGPKPLCAPGAHRGLGRS